jgi:hypothetical protein
MKNPPSPPFRKGGFKKSPFLKGGLREILAITERLRLTEYPCLEAIGYQKIMVFEATNVLLSARVPQFL